MEFDNSKLRGKIKEVFGTELNFCSKLGMAGSTLSAKLNNKAEFSRSEILKIVSLLKIDKKDIFEIFFLKSSFGKYENWLDKKARWLRNGKYMA